MLGQGLVIFLSLMYGSVWTKSDIPISKLVVQKYVNGRQETCSETCAGENLICNFEGINFVPLGELEAKIRELLPDKLCSDSNQNSTLTTISNEKIYDDNQLFSYNLKTQCTSRYIFTPGGPIPPCTIVPASYQLLICKCASKRDYNFIAQSISAMRQDSCNVICDRKGMTCNFEGIDRIPLEEIKAQIIDLFPGSFCYGENNKSFTLTVNPHYIRYQSGSFIAYNIANKCTARYMFQPNGPIPNCSRSQLSGGRLLVCKCQHKIDETATISGCPVTIKTAPPEIGGYVTNTTIVPTIGGNIANVTVVPATKTTCNSGVLSTEFLSIVGIGCGVVLICCGILIFGLFWLGRSQTRSARADSVKVDKKERSNMKSKKKRNKPAVKTHDSKFSCNKLYFKNNSSPRTKHKKSIKSKTTESTYTKTEAVKSVVYSDVPDTDYETVQDLRS